MVAREEPAPEEEGPSGLKKKAAGASNALVVEGGAMRGVFTTGVLDGFLQHRFNPFQLTIGVSSGAGNLAAYLAEMPQRNLKIYTDYSLRPEFMSLRRFIRGGHLVDLDWLWRITIAEIRLDLQAIYAKGYLFLVGMTDVRTGEAVTRQTGPEDLEPVLKASSAMPVLYRQFPRIDGRPMTDGGLSDPIPVIEAIRRDAKRIMVLRSRPRHYRKTGGLLQQILLWKLRAYPQLKQTAAARIRTYNDTLARIRKPPPGVSIVEICPPPDFQTTRLSRDPGILQRGYRQGRRLAESAIRHWEKQPAI
jgi:predicted patatin/cPLA2 family phospholipase